MGGHSIVIVGFDDSTGRFMYRNSWGTAYGQNGYGFIAYTDVQTVTKYIYVMSP